MTEMYNRLSDAYKNIISIEQVVKATKDLSCIGVLGLRPGLEICNNVRKSLGLSEIEAINPCSKNLLRVECFGCPIFDQALRLLVTYLPPKR